jgi:ABC-type antimicrobial peptide transport system permease subunit
VTLVPGVAVLVLVGLVACAAPTLRALRVSPTEALKDGG